ncbi:tetratricopeptide repeat protein [Cryptosporangium aurantiacum]|uniref:tetratricopeptide repeat protein n=1 Tax=Cryptosporangium aurantiacum TaxID=134849 RepID=UPI0009337AF6|nr:tetratricopeptide repeat protein [Cryptosporangium aurantiacum]
MTPETALRDRVVLGHTLLGHGRAGEAEQVLAEALPLVTTVGAHPNAFLTLRLLGQCARTAGRLDQARGYYSRALDVAEALGDPDLAGAAVSGMAYVELAADDLSRADGYFRQAVQLVRTVTPGPGRVTVLRNYADLLVRTGDLRAAAFYQEALDQPGVDPVDRAGMLVTLGRELCRRGRTAAGLDRLRAGVTLLTEAGPPGETFTALVTLAGLAAESEPATATDAFVRAHDLALTLHATVDVRHYTEGYAARVRRVEAETQRRADAGELPAVAPPAVIEATRGLGPDAARTVAVGAPAMIGARSLEDGERLLAEHRYDESDAKLRMAEVMWASLGAGHVLPQVWSAQGRLALARGDDEAAWTLLDHARGQAAALGDARTERSVLVALCELLGAGAEPRPPAGEVPRALRLLDLGARARGLASFLGEDAPVSPDAAAAAVTLDTATAALCERFGAFDLAERYLRAAIETAEQAPAVSSATGVARLVAYLARRGGGADVAALRERLVAEPSTDPLVRTAVDGVVGRIDAAAGNWSDATFERLAAACAAYEEVRAQPGGFGPGPVPEPPYEAAAEVAVRLGRYTEALALLERAEVPAVPEPGTGVRVVAFGGSCGAYALTAASGGPVTGDVLAANVPWSEEGVCAALAAVVDAASARGGAVAVTVVGALYGLPVQRTADGSARPGVSVLPRVSPLPTATVPPVAHRSGLVAVDPLDELPFARVAADHAAGRLGVGTLGGAAFTVERLAAELASASSPVVHLACRVVADGRRPERSALVLAGGERATAARLAAMRWDGALVVLSPGEAGGVPAVLVSAVLAAGATAVVAPARPVDGLAAAVLTTWFHDALPDRVTNAAEVDTALLAAQQRLRAATGDDLLTWAADRPVLRADQLGAITERADQEHPFADPGHWARWATYGTR